MTSPTYTQFLVKDKQGTWVKSCKESSKRESDVTVKTGRIGLW